MKYPTISEPHCEDLAKDLLASHASGFEAVLKRTNAHDLVYWSGDGVQLDLDRIDETARAIRERAPMIASVDRDQVEGQNACRLYEALDGLPVEVLDDPGFWRYLSLFHFWDFVHWRETRPFANGKHMAYLDGKNQATTVLTRMYLRISTLGGIGHADLASAVKNGTDFWRSHILRVRTGTAPAVTRALVRFQARHQLNTRDLRELAKRLNRTWTNIVPHALDDEEAGALIEELSHGLIAKKRPDTTETPS